MRKLTIDYRSGIQREVLTGPNVADHLAIEWALQAGHATATLALADGSQFVVDVTEVVSCTVGEHIDETDHAAVSQAHAEIAAAKSSRTTPVRYLAFAGERYYPGGGVDDLLGSFDDRDEAITAALADKRGDWAQVLAVTDERMEVVFATRDDDRGRTWPGGPSSTLDRAYRR